MQSNQISSVRTVQLNLPELQLPLRALMPATAAVTELFQNRSRAHLCHPMINRTDWRRMGELCVQSAKAADAAQGGRNAGPGAYDVTDSTFSTSVGPPSCSPPV
jgi:hypothetical protein